MRARPKSRACYHTGFQMLKDVLFIAIQRILPTHLLSRFAGLLTNSKKPKLKNWLIQKAIKRFNIDMTDALVEDPYSYETFNDFFTRALKPEARPFPDDESVFVSPCDGAISQIGEVQQGQVFQAKGHCYSLLELLGGETDHIQRFKNGQFATIYLSPRDYHRVHVPQDGQLTGMTFVPGKLFSVNQVTAENIPNLFARNERVVFFFDSPQGEFIVVMVGAMLVASIETPFAGIITPGPFDDIHHTDYSQKPITFKRGDELGRFRFGSTAIVVRPNGSTEWLNQWGANSPIRLGEGLA